ncbi:MAG: tetratricopeptide repeat protein [Haliea sp.]|nr:tetratricopeptide repeat protein [Haliea sp.]MDP5064868.1 tetratricopeptide repeat protein [Haliea sp.]
MSTQPRLWQRASVQIAGVTLAAALTLAWLASREAAFADLWLTRDQQGQRAMNQRDWKRAIDLFENPAHKATAAYYAGQYAQAADMYGRIPDAEGFYNRGNALMKAGAYRNAIRAFELAVAAAPGWPEAADNLALARYTSDYIEQLREDSDTGDESELSADDYVFDNEDERGKEMEITRESTIGLESAEKWMRSVDTDTAEFLRTRFALEQRQERTP